MTSGGEQGSAGDCSEQRGANVWRGEPGFQRNGDGRGERRHVYGKLLDGGNADEPSGELSDCARGDRHEPGRLRGDAGERHTDGRTGRDGNNVRAVELNSLTKTATVVTQTSLTPTGTVGFYEGPTLVGTGTLANGMASYTATALPAGNVTVTAKYSGDVKTLRSRRRRRFRCWR